MVEVGRGEIGGGAEARVAAQLMQMGPSVAVLDMCRMQMRFRFPGQIQRAQYRQNRRRAWRGETHLLDPESRNHACPARIITHIMVYYGKT